MPKHKREKSGGRPEKKPNILAGLFGSKLRTRAKEISVVESQERSGESGDQPRHQGELTVAGPQGRGFIQIEQVLLSAITTNGGCAFLLKMMTDYPPAPLVTSLTLFYHRHLMLLPLLQRLLASDLEKADEVLRDDTPGVLLATRSLELLGTPWLKRVLAPFFSALQSANPAKLEIDKALVEEKVAQKNLVAFAKLLETVLESLSVHLHKMPVQLRQLLSHVFTETGRLSPGAEFNATSALSILRFLGAAIIQPEVKQVIDVPLVHRRPLLLVQKAFRV